jgi:U3 small nucleolar RNA-associated protein 12
VGELQIFDLTSGTLVESVKAHEGAVWSMDVKPDGSGFVTGIYLTLKSSHDPI